MKRVLAVVLAAGFVVGSYATDARVVVMGRHSDFYRDEVSVFKNPSDISLYPDMLYGSFGWMDEKPQGSFELRNVYPQDPFFGGMMSYRISEEENGPMFSIGLFVNRRDDILETLMGFSPGVRNHGTQLSPLLRSYDLEEPIGKVDLILGYDLGNGLALGLGAYGAFQRVQKNDRVTHETSVFKGSAGINYNIDQGIDLEFAVSGGTTTAIASDTLAVTDRIVVSDGDFFWRCDVRLFSAFPALNASLVPSVSLQQMNLTNRDRMDLNGGMGINMNIDRGFFWAGAQIVYTQLDNKTQATSSESLQSVGGRFSFGIERNVITDWFLIRVGGQKEFRNVKIGTNNDVRWWENNPHDGSDGDLVALGFGLNIDNRLRIDFVASEDLPYTFTNIVSGNKSHIFNRVSATYRF